MDSALPPRCRHLLAAALLTMLATGCDQRGSGGITPPPSGSGKQSAHAAGPTEPGSYVGRWRPDVEATQKRLTEARTKGQPTGTTASVAEEVAADMRTIIELGIQLDFRDDHIVYKSEESERRQHKAGDPNPPGMRSTWIIQDGLVVVADGDGRHPVKFRLADDRLFVADVADESSWAALIVFERMR